MSLHVEPTAKVGIGTGTGVILHAADVLSARTSRLRVHNVSICGGCWLWGYSTFS